MLVRDQKKGANTSLGAVHATSRDIAEIKNPTAIARGSYDPKICNFVAGYGINYFIWRVLLQIFFVFSIEQASLNTFPLKIKIYWHKLVLITSL